MHRILALLQLHYYSAMDPSNAPALQRSEMEAAFMKHADRIRHHQPSSSSSSDRHILLVNSLAASYD
jgi:hypothetical protein